jgi:hypothetical protein
MNGLLMMVGIFVFMMTIYGVVVIGGHLLSELRAQSVLSDDLVSGPPDVATTDPDVDTRTRT